MEGFCQRGTAQVLASRKGLNSMELVNYRSVSQRSYCIVICRSPFVLVTLPKQYNFSQADFSQTLYHFRFNPFRP
jgi:hypothetical protein